MIARSKMISVLGLSLALLGASAWADKEAKTTAKVNEPAPAFTLKDTKGVDHKLSDYAGKIVVLEWFNPDCPFCEGVYKNGVVKKTIDEIKKIDSNVVYLAINSTAQNKTKEEVIASSDKFLNDQKMTSVPVLVDFEGTTGHAYGAKTTPHMFVIDTKGVLRYAGAITDDKSFKKTDATNYVINAVRQIKNGETVSPDNTQSWGCGVKYANKTEGDMGHGPKAAPGEKHETPGQGHSH
jgi:peroxiredoxin